MPTSVRVDAETEALLERAARLRSQTKSAVIREALRHFCARVMIVKAVTPYEAIREYVGCMEGPPDLSRRSRTYLRKILRAKSQRHPG